MVQKTRRASTVHIYSTSVIAVIILYEDTWVCPYVNVCAFMKTYMATNIFVGTSNIKFY